MKLPTETTTGASIGFRELLVTIRTRDIFSKCWTVRSRVCLSWDKTRPSPALIRESNEKHWPN